MAIDQTITPLPTPPSSGDPVNFRTRADAFVAALAQFVTQLNVFRTQANDTETNINAKEASAVAASAAAVASANHKGIFVQGTSNALVGESWSYSGVFYKCNVNTSNNPVTEPASWSATSFEFLIHAATSKITPVDADEFGIWDSVSGLLNRVSFSSLYSYLKAKFDILYLFLSPTGQVIFTAMNTAPSGFLKANGAAVSRTTYAALFTAIGTTFGAGDGSTTFNLPDLRGEFLRGWDDGRGIDAGRTFGSFQSDDFKSHVHAYTSSGSGTGATAGYALSGSSYYGNNAVLATGGTETRPRNRALLACIKY